MFGYCNLFVSCLSAIALAKVENLVIKIYVIIQYANKPKYF